MTTTFTRLWHSSPPSIFFLWIPAPKLHFHWHQGQWNKWFSQFMKFRCTCSYQDMWEELNETHSLIIGCIAVYIIFPSVMTSLLNIATLKPLSPAWSDISTKQSYQKSGSSNEVEVEVNGLKSFLTLRKKVNTNCHDDKKLEFQYIPSLPLI